MSAEKPEGAVGTDGADRAASLDAQFMDAIMSSKRAAPALDKLGGLLELGAHVDGPDRDGMPMRRAISQNSEPLVNFLLDAGADVHAEVSASLTTNTLLHWAAYLCRLAARNLQHKAPLAIIVTLIAAGADPAAGDCKGELPASLLGTDLSAPFRNVFSCPLHAAIELQRPDLCVKLLDRGHDPLGKNKKRQTAWSLAKSHSPECLGAMQSWLASRAIEDLLHRACLRNTIG